jgi:hypothetical protein
MKCMGTGQVRCMVRGENCAFKECPESKGELEESAERGRLWICGMGWGCQAYEGTGEVAAKCSTVLAFIL